MLVSNINFALEFYKDLFHSLALIKPKIKDYVIERQKEAGDLIEKMDDGSSIPDLVNTISSMYLSPTNKKMRVGDDPTSPSVSRVTSDAPSNAKISSITDNPPIIIRIKSNISSQVSIAPTRDRVDSNCLIPNLSSLVPSNGGRNDIANFRRSSKVTFKLDPQIQSARNSTAFLPSFKWTKGQLIGQGAFGKVYMGLSGTTGQIIAVKQVPLHNSKAKSQITPLESEIKIMEKLSHPNIVHYLGSERVEDTFNVLMEYIPGKSLDQIIEDHEVLDLDTIRDFTRQIVSALAYLHANGVVHRDIKGKNILVRPDGVCKLCDFGSAKQFEDIMSNTVPSISFHYTPLWTAPEVLLQNYGRKIDIWSLGCVIIEMSTGKPPWAEHKFINPFRALLHIGNTTDVPKFPEWAYDTPLMPDGKDTIFVDFLKQCLNRDPDTRTDASELLKHPFVKDIPDVVMDTE